jgi:hypothetical protein
MERQEQIELIRQKCIGANPEKWEPCIHCKKLNRHLDKCIDQRPPTIRLADVLLAISDPAVIITSHKGEFRHMGVEAAYWNLRKDDLTEQSDETLALLAELLK